MSPATILLSWFDRYGRDLPWRKTRDAYAILVSEVMLQQTQVARVTVFYKRWLERFPNWRSLSQATNAEVIAMWSGLGYNRRALMLRDVARAVVEKGEPKTEEEWRSLKGIGPYTAAALAAFSLHQRTLPIDTNIRRVGARLWLGIPFPTLKDDGRIRLAAEDFLPTKGRFYDIPQALFDLASLICKKTPACAVCPMQKICPSAKLFLSGQVQIPKQSIKKAVETKHRDKPYPDRIYRGRILKVVQTQKNVRINNVGTFIDPAFNEEHDQAWIIRMVERMKKDQLIEENGSVLKLHST